MENCKERLVTLKLEKPYAYVFTAMDVYIATDMNIHLHLYMYIQTYAYTIFSEPFEYK